MSRTDGSTPVDAQRNGPERATDDDWTLVVGTGVGVVAWLVGYAFTYAAVAPDVRDSRLSRIVELLGGDSATRELVGWVFYNAHLVDTVIRNLPGVGTGTANYVGGDGFTILLYAVPVLTLAGAGLALARVGDARTPTDGAVAGLTVLPGYFVLSLGGTFLFEVSVEGVTGGPDLLTAVVVAGIVYPAVFAGAGGALGGYRRR